MSTKMREFGIKESVDKVQIDKERLTTEMAFKEDSSAVIKIRQRLPDFLQSVKLKYVKLGYGYSCNCATIIMFVLIVPFSTAILVQFIDLKLERIPQLFSEQRLQLNSMDAAVQLAISTTLFILFTFYWSKSSTPVYLVDFACYKPEDECKMSTEAFLKMFEESGIYNEDSLQFKRRVMSRSNIGDETYLPKGLLSRRQCLEDARAETEPILIGVVGLLFEKTGVKPSEIGILVVNSSLFNPVPSLSSVIVNHFKLRSDIKNYSLGGMGCSAGLIAVDLANNLLKANPDTYAIVASTENISLNGYAGNERSMLLGNCLFRMGGSAVLFSNKANERSRSKYQLVHLVRTHPGADEKHYNCARLRKDNEGNVGVSISKDIITAAGEALKTNITTLGPLVLPWTEQFRFCLTIVRRKVFKAKVKPYIPDFKLAFEHFCLHSGGKAVLEELQKNLKLDDWDMEPSRMSLHRFGNVSSSSVWYELAYAEGKGRVSRGDRVWQIAFGSGFKCNSVVWRSLREIPVGDWRGNPWVDSIDKYPVKLP